MRSAATLVLLILGLSAAHASPSNGSITVTSPANNSSDPTPVTVSASATTPPTCSAGVAALGIYPTPGNLLFKTTATSFSKSFILNPGSYPNFIVQEWDKCGGVSKLSLNITVTGSLPAPQPVTTWGYGSQRNNVNTKEYILTPTNVNVNTFGKKFSYSVDGYIYGQPLYVPALTVNGAKHNVVYVATENNSVYAFDADGRGQLWKTAFGSAIPCGGPSGGPNIHGCGVAPVIGVTATPVIDTALGNIYVESRHYISSTNTFSHKIHSLSLTTGLENPGSPVTISATVSGTGYDSSNGNIKFNNVTPTARPALLELGGVIYVAYASFGDADPYHGWVLGYSASNLSQVAVYNTTRNGKHGGIWGGPVASDGTSLFIATGNGTVDSSLDVGNSYVRLT